MTPVAGLGGAAAAGTKQPEPLVPGSAVSAVLVRGDLSISGTCTVTYVDATRLLACGHPITQYRAGVDADDEGGGGGDAGKSAECVQDHQYDGDGGIVYGGPGVGDYGAVWGGGADDSGEVEVVGPASRRQAATIAMRLRGSRAGEGLAEKGLPAMPEHVTEQAAGCTLRCWTTGS